MRHISEYARVVSVDEDIVSGQLATDHAVGTATLSLDSVLGLEEPEEGQRLTFKIAPGTGNEELVEADLLDDDMGTMHLVSPIDIAHLEGTMVEAVPRAISRIAWVRLDDDDEDAELVDATVPHALYEKVPVGIRTPGTEEAVSLEDSYDEWQVTDVLHSEPEIDATFLKVPRLSTLSADMGTLTAGSIVGGRITGVVIRTDDPPSARIVMVDPEDPDTGGNPRKDRINVYGSSGLVGFITSDTGDMYLSAPGGDQNFLRVTNTWVKIGKLAINQPITLDQQDLTNPTPNVIPGNAEALPGSSNTIRPHTWMPIVNPNGERMFIPCFK